VQPPAEDHQEAQHEREVDEPDHGACLASVDACRSRERIRAYLARHAQNLYYVAVFLCAAAFLFAAVGQRRLVAVIAPGGICLVWAAGMQLREGRRGQQDPLDRTMEYRLLGLMAIGVIWVIVGVGALTA
jgi:hypothetical protein